MKDLYKEIDDAHKLLNAYKLVSAYTISAVEAAIKDIDKSIQTLENESLKVAFKSRKKALEKALKTIINNL